MPNHVHTLLVQNPDYPLEDLLRSWKTFTSRTIHRLVEGSGTLWQRSYFDRLVRDEKHFPQLCSLHSPKSREGVFNGWRTVSCAGEKVFHKQIMLLFSEILFGSYILYESDLAKQIE
jgi:hypothetical protein